MPGRSPPAACPTSARPRSTSRSRPALGQQRRAHRHRRRQRPSPASPAATYQGPGRQRHAATAAGSDLLDGGPGNDQLNGGVGIDLAYFGGSTAVTVDLSGADTAKRGTETDTLTGIEGAIGSSAADTFKGDGSANWFQGGRQGHYTGGGGRDLYDFNAVTDSRAGSATAT